MKMNRKGFTLIELLIVVAIIGILAAIAIPNFLEAQVRAKVAKAQSEMRNMAVSLETYRIDHNAYASPTTSGAGGILVADPGTPGELMVAAGNTTVDSTLGDLGQALSTPIAYSGSIPLDPFRKEDAKTYYTGTAKGRYRYATNFLSCWIMSSFGPDQAETGVSETNFPNLTSGTAGAAAANCDLQRMLDSSPSDQTGGGDGVLYDSTNGTTSLGDVIKTGP